MRLSVIGIVLCIACAHIAQGQTFSAGPDVTICSGSGALIGLEGQVVDPSWCIHWSPEAGLDDPRSARPKATPKNTLVYTVTVLTEDWEHITTDEVTVTVGFGGIKFTPPYLFQGSDATVQSELTINPDDAEVTWSITGESLGCEINAETGEITPGDEFGTITVRATKVEDTNCFAEETIEINEGVKDVTARDVAHPGRIAKGNRDTLYLIGENHAIITAVPNASGFPQGYPIWHDDGSQDVIVLPPGTVTHHANLGGLLDVTHRFVAGSSPGFKPSVTVISYNSTETVIDLSPLVNALTDKVKEVNDRLKEVIGKKFPQVPNLNVEVNVASFKYKKAPAEKYNDPGWGYKYTVEAGGTLALSGRLYHPAFTQVFDVDLLGISAGTELYLEPIFEASLVGAAIKDPSKQNPDWTFLDNFKANMTGGIRGVYNVVGTAAGYSLEGGFSLISKLAFDFNFNANNGKLTLKITFSPMQGKTKLLVERYIDPKNKWTFFDYTIDLINKRVSPEYLIYDFGAQDE